MKRQGGLFITFEGGDGAGKTTLIERLYKDLTARAHHVLKTRAPGGSPIGSQIRQVILSHHESPMSERCELLLYMADRAQHVDEVLLPALSQNQIILCDRFNDSTLAYQSGGRGISPERVLDLCHYACNGLMPHLTLYLDLDPLIGMERVKRASGTKDRIESEALEFHQNIRAAFHLIAKKEPKRFILLDASKSPDSVFTAAKERIDALL
ncbi:MAG: dTMP kinase [Verrucomicrobia bacterium]|nr:dTMP kinase [Verrucomicrobiota bacterium]